MIILPFSSALNSMQALPGSIKASLDRSGDYSLHVFLCRFILNVVVFFVSATLHDNLLSLFLVINFIADVFTSTCGCAPRGLFPNMIFDKEIERRGDIKAVIYVSRTRVPANPSLFTVPKQVIAAALTLLAGYIRCELADYKYWPVSFALLIPIFHYMSVFSKAQLEQKNPKTPHGIDLLNSKFIVPCDGLSLFQRGGMKLSNVEVYPASQFNAV